MKFGHKANKQGSYKFVIDKFSIKLHLQAILKQFLSATQNML